MRINRRRNSTAGGHHRVAGGGRVVLFIRPGRKRQLSALTERVRRLVPAVAPLFVAGDFNDWRNNAGRALIGELSLAAVFRDQRGRPARIYPSALPLLRSDWIYARGFSVVRAEVHHGLPWSRISDHAALSAELELS